MLAFAMMVTIRHRANTATPKKNTAQISEHLSPSLIRWSIQEIRRIARECGIEITNC